MPAPALELIGISKHFGPVQALIEANFAVRPGEIHALLGENGAGKSTLMHVAFGLLAPDAGSIRVRGRPATMRSPRVARRLGLGMVHQHFTSVPALTVEENLRLAAGGSSGGAGAWADGLLGALLAGVPREALVETLPVGQKQRLEIAKALAAGASILLLDEPTAVLAPAEVGELMALMRAFAGRGGAVVLITHKLREVFDVAETVTVLRHGRVTLHAPLAGQTSASLAEAMLGREVARAAGAAAPGHAAPGDPVVTLAGVEVRPLEGRGPGIRGASLVVRAGEIVGVAAIEGNGQRELMLAIAGLVAPVAGRVDTTPPVAFIPEDRTTEGLIPEFSLAENVALGGGRSAPWVRGAWMDWAKVERHTADVLRAFDIRAPDPRFRTSMLSGGNQQRLVLGRALAQRPRVLVAENPTRGLDIQAMRAVHAAIREAARAGVGVLVYSGDLDEVLGLADRCLVVAGGRVAEMAPGAGREEVGGAMLEVGQSEGRKV